MIDQKVRIRVYGHPVEDGAREMVAEHEFVGMGFDGYPQLKGEGARLFATVIDYRDMHTPGFKLARQAPQTIIVTHFENASRQGGYISCPFGGAIEIEAL